MSHLLHIHEDDNVVNALADLLVGQVVLFEGQSIEVLSAIPMGHKMSIKPIPREGDIIKYGKTIGYARVDIRVGEHVHIHNVRDPIANWREKYDLPDKGDR
jgi:altronate hydrolase